MACCGQVQLVLRGNPARCFNGLMYIVVLRLVVDDFYSLWNKSLIDFDWIPGRGENTTGLIKMKKKWMRCYGAQ